MDSELPANRTLLTGPLDVPVRGPAAALQPIPAPRPHPTVTGLCLPPHTPFQRLPGFKFRPKTGRSKTKDPTNRFRYNDLVRHAVERDGDVCWYCGQRFTRLHYFLRRTLEHFVPKAHPRAHEPETTCVAHTYCNSKAADGDLDRRVELRKAYRKNPDHVLNGANKLLARSLERKQRRARLRNQQE